MGMLVCRFSKTQNCVMLSPTEAEYVAMTETMKGEIFLHQG